MSQEIDQIDIRDDSNIIWREIFYKMQPSSSPMYVTNRSCFIVNKRDLNFLHSLRLSLLFRNNLYSKSSKPALIDYYITKKVYFVVRER